MIYVGEPRNICLNATRRQTEDDQNLARRKTPGGPLKRSAALASAGILYRGENAFSKGLGGPLRAEHWITFSFSYSSQGHMSSAHCAAGGPDSLPVSFSMVVTYTGHITERGKDGRYLSHYAILSTFAYFLEYNYYYY